MFESIEKDLVRIVESTLASLAPGRATICVKRYPEIEHDGVSIWVTPANRRAAQIVIDAKDGERTISLRLGAITPYEVYRQDEREALDEVRRVCLAVMRGRFEESLAKVGSEIVSSKATVGLEGGDVTVFFGGRIFPLRKKVLEQLKYEPYVSGGAVAT